MGDYNIFGDIAFPTVWALVSIIAGVLNRLLRKCADLGGLWIRKSMLGTVDDDIAAKLAIGEGRQEDLEAERLELQAMNSERFRHRFLERSRPWVLQHLTELLTPRTLQMPGADGAPNIEYIRDVYMDLMNMGLGKRQAGDRGDISSDDEEYDPRHAQRNWSRVPVEGASKAIALEWLRKARQRKTCTKLVRGYMQKKMSDTCDGCGRTTEMGATMRVLITNEAGEVDGVQLSRLIHKFDEAQGDKPF